MEENMVRPDSASGLRARAERIIQETPENIHHIPADDLQKLIHELHVHQIELELQNEELRRAQRISEEAQRRYFDLYDLAPVGYFTISRNGQILEVNLAGTNSLGIEKRKLISTLFIQFIIPEDRDIFLSYRDKSLETCMKQTCELRMQTADDTLFHVHTEIVANQDDGEKEEVLKLTISDISQLKKMEARQRLIIDILSQINQMGDTKDMIRNIVLSVRDFSGTESVAVRMQGGGIFTKGFSAEFVRAENHLCVADADGRILRDAKGYPIPEGATSEGNNLLPPFFTPNGSFWTNSTSQFIAFFLEKTRQARTRNYCKREGYESLALIPLHSGKDVIGLLQLNDRRKDMFDPEAIRFFEGIGANIGMALHREQLMKEKEKLAEQLSKFRKMQAIGTFAGGIAHDFNNMLSVILGNTELVIEDTDKRSPIHDYLAEIKKTSLRARDTVRQIMVSAQKPTETRLFMNFEPVVRSALKALVPENIRVEHHFSADNDLVFCNPSQIYQIVMNLIKNAEDAMGKEGGVLGLELKNERLEKEAAIRNGGVGPGAYVKLSVSDTGTGIIPEITERIFDPYFTTKDVGKGSGLGLSAIQGILCGIGGDITVDSQLGRGSTFHIWIPLADEPAEAQVSKAEKHIVRAADKKAPRHQEGQDRILIVDDQELVLRMLKTMLNRMGYAAESATDGALATEMYREAYLSDTPFDLVILDLTIPGGMGGVETLSELLKLDPNVKAIVSSGYSDDPVMADYKDYGFCGAVPKPYTMAQLAALLKFVFREED